MSKLATLVAGGIFPDVAKAINVGEVSAALTATGTTQADALAVSKDLSWFGTVATGTGAVLPASAEVGDAFIVVNAGANALAVYPPVGGAINGNTANASVSVASKAAAIIRKVTATDWARI